MTVGERGPHGDHGQDGERGKTGATGDTGDTGLTGKTGPPGKDVLTRMQTFALFGFIVFAFVVLAARNEHNSGNIRDGVVHHDKFVQEVCADHPEFAPITCANRH